MFDTDYWARIARNPVVLLGLLVDLAPVFAVIFWGWRAAPLVMLYWMENLVIGVMTPPRMIYVSVAKSGVAGLFGALSMSAFFAFHYGMFCFAHGVFLTSFLSTFTPVASAPGDMPFDFGSIIAAGLASGRHVDWMLGLIVAFQVFLFVYNFVLRGEWKNSAADKEMMAPYGRVLVLHFGLFVGAGALGLVGDPMIGVLALILLRVIWGVRVNTKPRKREAAGTDDRDAALAAGKTGGA